jgi:hypothetical protein
MNPRSWQLEIEAALCIPSGAQFAVPCFPWFLLNFWFLNILGDLLPEGFRQNRTWPGFSQEF